MFGIRIAYTLVLTSSTKQIFYYFENFIKSSTKIYQTIQNIYQNHEHSAVVQLAEDFIDTIDSGFDDDTGEYANENQIEGNGQGIV